MTITFQRHGWYNIRGTSAAARRQRAILRELDLNGRGAERKATPSYRWNAGIVDLTDRLLLIRHPSYKEGDNGIVNLSPTQQALYEAWKASEHRLSELSARKPILKDNPTPEEHQSHLDRLYDWGAEWHNSNGYRDGLHKACELAGIKEFQPD